MQRNRDDGKEQREPKKNGVFHRAILNESPGAAKHPGQNENDPNDQKVNLNPSCIMRGW